MSWSALLVLVAALQPAITRAEIVHAGAETALESPAWTWSSALAVVGLGVATLGLLVLGGTG